jgi:3-hydroxybutyryl-CoA dehydratase
MGGVQQWRLADLQVGMTESIEVEATTDAVDAFANLSGDLAPLHTDAAFARSRGFGGRVVHGLLIGAWISRLVGTRLPGAAGILQSIELEFRRPVVPPQRLRVHGEITHVSHGTGQVTLRVAVEDADGGVFVRGRVRSVVRD